MNLTIINRTIIGFATMFILMTLIAIGGFWGHNQAMDAYMESSGVLMPIVQDSNKLVIHALNANKAVFQHATAVSNKQKSELESRFSSSVNSYRKVRVRLKKAIANMGELNQLLQQADNEIEGAFDKGVKQLAIRNEFVNTKEISRSEIQNYTARWITFTDERDAAIKLANKQGHIERFAVSSIADSLTLAKTTLGGVNNIENIELLSNMKQNLDQQSETIESRIEKIEVLAPESAKKLKPFSDFLSYSVRSENGYLSLSVKLIELGNQIREFLSEMGNNVNKGKDLLNELTNNIDTMINDKNRHVEESSSQVRTITIIIFVVTIIVCLLICISQTRSINKPLKSIASALKSLSNGDLTDKIDINTKDEFGTIALGINELTRKLGELLSNIKENSATLNLSTESALDATHKSDSMLNNQKLQTDSVATAITEMEAAASEVARNTDSSLNKIRVIEDLSSTGGVQMKNSITSIKKLDSDINEAVITIEQMREESRNINGILEVITSIAEQTSLLSLNAAIEAARAGEQGKGFAVVADEVRTLASKTQKSTEEIYKMIESLQKISVRSVDIMNKNRNSAKNVVVNSNQAARSLTTISEAIEEMAQLSELVAAAALEQSQVTQDISCSIVKISSSAEEVCNLSNSNRKTFDKLMVLSGEQQEMTEQFTI